MSQKDNFFTFEKISDLVSLLERRTGRNEIPVRKIFVCNLSDSEQQETPLHKLCSAGRGNPVAIKLYLAIIWMAVSKPYEIDDIPASGWANLIGVSDPYKSGKRRIYNALKKLEEENLILIKQFPGKPPRITLLLETGDGEKYVPPGFAAILDKSRKKPVSQTNIYFKIPTSLWEQGIIPRMSGSGLAMYLILVAEQADIQKKGTWFSMSRFRQRYGFDDRTRARGMKELQNLGILKTEQIVMDAYGFQEFSLGGRQRRNVYHLINPLQEASSLNK